MGVLDDAPELYPDVVPFWEAFMQLCLSRSASGNGSNPLSVSDIYAWLKIHGVSDYEQRVAYYESVVALDMAWLKHQREVLDDNRENAERK